MSKHQILAIGLLTSLTSLVIGLAAFIWLLRDEPIFWFGLGVFLITLIPFVLIWVLQFKLLSQLRSSQNQNIAKKKNQIIFATSFCISLLILVIVWFTVGINPPEATFKVLIWIPFISLAIHGVSLILSLLAPEVESV